MSVCAAAGLLSTWQATVLKGNAGELAAIADSSEVQAKGVDSVGQGFADPARFVRELAQQHRASFHSSTCCIPSLTRRRLHRCADRRDRLGVRR